MTDCKDDKCKVVLDSGNKDYLLSLSHEQVKLVTHGSDSRKRFFKAMQMYDCELKVVRK